MAMLLYEKNVDSTFYYTVKARKIADRLGYDKGNVDALNNLGVVFDIKGNLQLALRYYNEAYAGYTELHDTANRVQTLMNIAMVYKELGKDQRAIQRFNATLALGEKLGRDSIMSLAIYNYLLAYPAHFSPNSMSYYIARAKAIANKYRDERTLVAIDQLIADNMIANRKREKGLALLDSSITSAINKNLFYVSMDMLIDIGDQLATTDPKRAATYYLRGLAISNRNDYLIYSQLIARKLFDFYTANKDSVKASVYSRQLIALHDEQEKLNGVSGIDYLDYALKDQQVKSLTVRSKYQTAFLVLAIVVFSLAVTVIIAVRHSLKRTKQLNENVTSQNVQMKRALDALEQSQEDNSRMMKIAAHDLRNPIGGMYSIASMMLDEPDRSENDRMMLELIKTSGQNSLELVSDLLQVQFKTEELKKEPVDIGEMLKYCVSLLSGKAAAKGQQVNLQAQSFVLAASREKLWRVVSNLIANAIKFSPSSATIDVKMEHNAQRVLIAVKDHGIGIPTEMHDKIFDMFTEAKRPGTAGEQAFGLGLAISKQIVEAHGGKIWFESTSGMGTTFFVELPVVN
ncbi:MAG: tetratricopeptide repeat-containing sensor histidine kinase [Bacteroidota bacterium]|nr:tetratricopeptide repeat-containing sensor histidine kinase [Bacteroidota bacterium]